MNGTTAQDGDGGKCRGQVMTEYAVVLATFLVIMLMLVFLLAVFTETGWRMVSLISVDL